MIDNENWDPISIQAEFAGLNRKLATVIVSASDVKHSPLVSGPDNDSPGVEYSLRRHGLLYEVFRALPKGRLIKITEKEVESRELLMVTSQGEQIFTDFVSTQNIYRIQPDGKWELDGESGSSLEGNITSWNRAIPPREQKILQIFGLNPMDDAFMRSGIRRTREIAKQI